MSALATGIRRAGWLSWPVRVALLATAYAFCWAAGMAFSRGAPTLDSAEQLVWSYALEAGYWKHPPLPSWIMHGLVAVFGPSVALPFFAAQACTAIALALMWRLGCEFMSPLRSLAAAALTALVGYHGWSAYEYNHNTALLPFQAAALLAFWFALQRRAWGWWVLAGACAGAAMLVKYVAVFPLAAMALYFAARRGLHTPRRFAGMAIAVLAGFAVCAPHIAWLLRNQFPPFQYARAVAVHAPDAASWLRGIGRFVLMQVLLVSPLLVVLAWTLRRGRGDARAGEAQAAGDRLFLWVVGVAPLALLLAFAAVTGTVIEPRWGSNMFLGAGWLVMDLLGPREALAARLARAAAWLQAALFLAVAFGVPAATSALHWQGRAQFPSGQFAALAMDAWSRATPQPLRLVVADTWLAGTLSAATGRPLAVLADGDYARAAWVRPEDIAACGALVLQDRSVPAAQWRPGVTQLLEAAPWRGEWVLPWTPRHGLFAPGEEGRRIAWAVLPPHAGGACRLASAGE